ncbi:MAG: hypothetical protein GX879_09140 [Bacteroidales bacterium]|nr:hypothetical protein [Bacteroidales bacterium]
MKNLGLSVLLVLLCSFVFAAESPRDPFIVLKVNGTEYKKGARISVRSGEQVHVEAVLYGGRRDYCSNPHTYANVGNNTVVETQGENGMSFNINGGQFRGVWTLTEEIASFKSGPDVVITPNYTNPKLKRAVNVEFKAGNYSEVFFNVDSETKWHYVRNTPAGRTEENDVNKASAKFTFVLEVEKEAWFSTKNVIAHGMEDFSIRNSLDDVQRFYNEIEKCLLNKDISCAQMHFRNLQSVIGELPDKIDRAKQKDPNFECEISFVGSPTDLSMRHIADLKFARNQWKENFIICSKNAQNINEMLLNTKFVLTGNILRSVFKNYINWSGALPTDLPSLLTIYDPKNIYTPLDLPRNLLSWYEEAENDAGILKNQFSNIKLLSELKNYYTERYQNSLEEAKNINEIVNDLKPIENFGKEVEAYMKTQDVGRWIAK